MITARRRKQLRKRLDANSTAAKRLSSAVFYLDESIYSRRLADAMREAGAQVVTPYEGGLAGSTDESWLALIGSRRWLAARVNAVNTVGVMGKGIALMFKKRFRENFEQYAVACKNQQVRIGKMFITTTSELDGPKWIVNFPTKQNWRAASKLEWIVEGLKDLRRFIVIVEERVLSIAIPALGAGNGGLNWSDVKAEIEKVLGDLTDVDIVVFEPMEQHQGVQSTQAL